MNMLRFLGKPLYGGETARLWYHSPRETYTYADEGKMHIISTHPSAGNSRRDGQGARTGVRNEIGPEKCDVLLDTMEEAFGAIAIERMAAKVSRHLTQEKGR